MALNDIYAKLLATVPDLSSAQRTKTSQRAGEAFEFLTQGYTVDLTTGIVTFTVAPGAGVAVTSDYDFDVPVRFDTDMLSVRIDGPAQYMWDSIPIVETRI